MAEGGNADDRRNRSDRREGSAQEGRRGGPRATSPLTYILRSLGAIVVLMGVILYAVRITQPVYATRGTLGDELRKHAPEVAGAIAAGDSTTVDQLMATPKFQKEKRNFFEDVMRLKQVDSARADSIAHFAVREAYMRGISPAIIFGVMLTENSKFVSNATSNVGAIGLMQVYPKIWLTKEMTKLFGGDLATDSTNVKYGVFILNQYFKPKDKRGQVRERDWATALLRYNGCVKGTNTPRCHTYPSKVKSFIENQGTSICNGRGFYECIAKPFIDGLMGGVKDTATAAAAPRVAAPAPAAPTVQQAATSPAPPPAAPVPVPVATAPERSVAKGLAVTAPPAVTKRTSPPPRATSRATSARAKTASTSKRKASPRPARRASRPSAEIPPPPKPIIIRIP